MDNNNEVILSVKVDAGDAQKQLDDLEKKFDAIMTDNSKSRTFAELTKQMEEVAKLSEEFKKHNLEGTSVMNSLTEKAKELNNYAESIAKEFGELSNNTFDNLANQTATAAVEAEKLAESLTVIESNATTSGEAVNNFQKILDFGEQVLGIEGLSNAFDNAKGQFENASKKLEEYKNEAKQAEVNNKALTTATNAQTTATNTTATASKALRGVLASMGIGLIVMAVSALFENWEKVKKALDSVLPVGKQTTDIFYKIKEVIFGVGNVIIQYLLTPIKTFIKLIQGDFKGAINEVKNGYNVVGNYKSGSDVAKKQNADDKESKRLVDENKELDKSIEIDRARGINTRVKEQKRINNEIKNAELKGEKDLLEEKRHQKNVLEAGWKKEDDDKAKQLRDKSKAEAKAKADKRLAEEKKELDEAKKLREEALKLQAEADKEYSDSLLSDRDRELKDLESKYEKESDILAKHNLSNLSLTENYNAKVKEVNDKYNKQEEEARNKKQENERKLLAEIEAIKTEQANLNIAKLELQYDNERAFRLDNELSIINEITNAKIEAEMQAFEAEKIRIGDNKSELELLEQEHQFRLTQIENQASKDRKAIKVFNSKTY